MFSWPLCYEFSVLLPQFKTEPSKRAARQTVAVLPDCRGAPKEYGQPWLHSRQPCMIMYDHVCGVDEVLRVSESIMPS